jgi:hypothetical protein
MSEIEDNIGMNDPFQRLDLVSFLKRWDRDLSGDRRTYGVKLCFAGAESKSVRDGFFRIGVKHILMSYYHLGKWFEKASLQEIGEDLGRFDFVFLDSGAYTFMSEFAKGKKSKVSIREYTEKYYDMLPKVHHLFAGCAEVDVLTEFSNEEMKTFRDTLLDKGVSNIVPVYHGQDLSMIEEHDWFKNHVYLGIGSVELNDASCKGKVQSFVEKAKSNGNLIHGFGVTDVKAVLKSQLYSVDSTSWSYGSHYGQTVIFQNGRIRYYDTPEKDVRKRYKARFEEAGLIWADIEADKSLEVKMMNALAFKQWSDYVKYNVNNSYWLNAEEKDLALDLKSKAFNSEGLIDRKESIARASRRRLAVVTDAEHDDRAHETLLCDQCHMSGRCPRYKHNQPCGYDVNIRLQTKADLQKAIQNILEVGYGRVMTGVLFEKLEGGILDRNVSGEIQNFIGLVKEIKSIFDTREELTIKAKGGQGAVSQMLSKVFSIGSGNTQTQRAATISAEQEETLQGESSAKGKETTVIEVEPEHSEQEVSDVNVRDG